MLSKPIFVFKPEYREKQWKQQRNSKRLNTADNIARDNPARHRRTHDKCTEHRVRTDEIGEPRTWKPIMRLNPGIRMLIEVFRSDVVESDY